MGIVDATFRTLTCGSCDKTTTFNVQDFQNPELRKNVLNETPWISTYRILNTVLDGRVWGFCSDECTLKAMEKGEFNPVEKKLVQFPTGNNLEAIKQAAAAAAQKAELERRLKAGEDVQVRIQE